MRAAILAIITVTSAGLGADREPHEVTLKKPICEQTAIKEISCRLEGGDLKESGTAIQYVNGVTGVSYDYIPAISERSRVGDPVKLCLISQYVDCPKGDDRGK